MDLDQNDASAGHRGLETEIVADLHFNNFLFCHSAKFSPAKTSCFLSIMKLVFRAMVDEKLSSEATFDLLRMQLLRHSVPRPPWSIAVFSANDLKVLTDYVVNTFFRHFKLYEELAERETSIAGEAQRVIALALERRCAKVL